MLRPTEQKREPFPDEPGVRRGRFAAYQAIALRPDVVVIDATQPIEAVQRAIGERIF